jgi:WD40 repeat protein
VKASSTLRTLPCLRRPTAAATASLATVILFTALLGVVFLPREVGWLNTPDYVSVTHCLVPDGGRPVVSLSWSIAPIGRPGWQHHVAIHVPDGGPRRIECPRFDLNPLSLAEGPDADHFLLGNWDGTIYLLDVRHPEAEPVLIGRQSDGGVVALAWCQAERCVLSQSAFHLYAWDATTSSQRWRLDRVAPYCLALHPRAKTAIVSRVSGELCEIDLRDGHTLRTLACYGEPARAVSFSPRGSEIAVQKSNGSLMLLDARTGSPLWEEDQQRVCQTAAGRFIAFSPCGTLLVTAGRASGAELSVWSVTSGQRQRELRGHHKMVSGAAFSADGVLCSWSADGTIRAWDLRTGTMRQVAAIGSPQRAT